MKPLSLPILCAALLLAGCGDDSGTPDAPETGTVAVAVEPGDLEAPWTLTGPDGYSHGGVGDETLSGRAAGDYDVTWLALPSWAPPLPQSQTLAEGETITFTGQYGFAPPSTGTVVLDIEPDDLQAAWVLKVPTGGGANDRSGHGDALLADVPAGPVTVDWEEIPGWSHPAPGYVTAELVGGTTLALSETYTLLPAWPLEFVRVATGGFLMGSPATEPGAVADEWPRHEVTLSRGLWVSVAEITNAQWDEVMADGRVGDPTSANLPVTLVSWRQAVDFCNALSLAEGRPPAYTVDGDVTWDPDAPGYRLPTEAEWEYLCRAGTTTALSAGELARLECESDPVLTYFGWYCANAEDVKRPVRSLYPNDLGLYDMHGNAGEYCWDAYASDYYDVSPAVDPTGPEAGLYRVVRGGNYLAYGANCRSAARQSTRDFEQNPAFGFRVVRLDPGVEGGAAR